MQNDTDTSVDGQTRIQFVMLPPPALGRSINTVRPRLTELLQAGLIQRSGDKRKTASGRNAHVLIVATVAEVNL